MSHASITRIFVVLSRHISDGGFSLLKIWSPKNRVGFHGIRSSKNLSLLKHLMFPSSYVTLHNSRLWNRSFCKCRPYDESQHCTVKCILVELLFIKASDFHFSMCEIKQLANFILELPSQKRQVQVRTAFPPIWVTPVDYTAVHCSGVWNASQKKSDYTMQCIAMENVESPIPWPLLEMHPHWFAKRQWQNRVSIQMSHTLVVSGMHLIQLRATEAKHHNRGDILQTDNTHKKGPSSQGARGKLTLLQNETQVLAFFILGLPRPEIPEAPNGHVSSPAGREYNWYSHGGSFPSGGSLPVHPCCPSS